MTPPCSSQDVSIPLVLFHGPHCLDGFAAAYSAYRALSQCGAEFIPVNYGQSPPDVRGRAVYILDFSYKMPEMQAIHDACKSLILLDHHESAYRELLHFGGPSHPKAYVEIDTTRSGAMIAWQHFHPDREPPWLIKTAQDRDLWKFELPHTRELHAALASYPLTFSQWDRFSELDPHGMELLIHEGAAILRAQQQQIDAICQNAGEGQYEEHRFPLVNSAVLISEIGNQLAAGKPFAAVWFVDREGKR